jgi:hypothetical protein
MLFKLSGGCKEETPQLHKLSFLMLVQFSMPARLTRSHAHCIRSSVTPGLIPSKLASPPSSAANPSVFNLLNPAKPWRDVAVQARPHKSNTSSCCKVLRGCRLLKVKGAWSSASSLKLCRYKEESPLRAKTVNGHHWHSDDTASAPAGSSTRPANPKAPQIGCTLSSGDAQSAVTSPGSRYCPALVTHALRLRLSFTLSNRFMPRLTEK